MEKRKVAPERTRKATAQGHAFAQNNPGLSYQRGRGVSRNYVLGHMWFSLAVVRGNKHAKTNKTRPVKRMTAAQFDGAKVIARNWRTRNEKN